MSQTQTRKEQVLQTLKKSDGPMQRAQILEDHDISGTRLSNVLDQLREEGKVVRVGHGEYDLAERSRVPAGDGAGSSDLVTIPLIRIDDAASEDGMWKPQIANYLTVDKDIITTEDGADPTEMGVIRVSGDSMEETILAGDRVLIERHVSDKIVEGVVYVWRSKNSGIIVKRAHWVDSDTLELVSDNDRYSPIQVRYDETNDWKCIGRVVRVMRAL